MGDQDIRFAVVGCGRIAERHVRHIGEMGQLVAACDPEFSRAEKLTAPFGAAPFGSLDEMMALASEIDVVSICSPNGLHATHSIQSSAAGCHVLCEKPMALTTAECGSMIKAAERANRRLVIVKQNRFNPPIVALKRAIDDERLGRVLSVQLNCFWNRNENYYRNDPWKGTLALDGGCLFTQFSHFLDLLCWMIGDLSDVDAFANNFCHQDSVEFEDCGVVAMRFANGTLGSMHFTINSYRKNMEGSLTVFGEKGTVKIGGQYLNLLEYQSIQDYEMRVDSEGKGANNYGDYVGSMSNHDEVYANLIDVLQNDQVVATSGFEGLKTVEIIEKIYERIRWNPEPSTQGSSRWNSVRM